jgi:hypothetical protein
MLLFSRMPDALNTARANEPGAPSPADTTAASKLPDDPELVKKAMAFLEQKSTPEEAARRGLPIIETPGGYVSITESAEALFKAIAPKKELFYRGGVVVELIQEGAGYQMQILDAVAAQSRFEKYGRFIKKVKQGDDWTSTATNISEATAKQYLKSEACRTLLPKLNGILHCALLVEQNGCLHRVEEGYDETTGFFVAMGQKPQEIKLVDAVGLLDGLVNDFDFVTPGDRSRAIASLLTPALKLGGLIKGPVPVDVAEANASQSGKTYRQRMVAALYNQRPAVVTKKGGGVGSMEETFNDHLVKGRVFIQFDNVRGKLDSQYLEAFLTADGSFGARIPFQPTVTIDPSKFIVFISSNGFEATKDLTNRASIIRIRKRENHQFRTSNGRSILQLMYEPEWQSLLRGCLFAVVEEWHRQGKPKSKETRHDFREWCQSLDWIVQNLFHQAPLMDGHQQAKDRASSPQLSFLRAVAIKLNEKQRLGQKISASDLADLCIEGDILMPGLSEENQTVEEGRKQIGKIMGKLFGDKSELIMDEFKVARLEERGKSEAGNDQTLYRYTFSLVSVANPPQPVPASCTTSPPPPPPGLNPA